MADAYRIKDQYVAYFITLTVIDWVDVFTRKEYKDILIDNLKYCVRNKGLQVYEFVIMSNHLHAIVSSDKFTSQQGLRYQLCAKARDPAFILILHNEQE